VTQSPHLSIEARLTRSAPGPVLLAQPPAAGPAGTRVAGLVATDDRGTPLDVRQHAGSYVVGAPRAGAIRFRYRLDVQHLVADGSTGAGLDFQRLYAVTRSLFVAPDPTAYRKTDRAYPIVLVDVLPPPGWQVVGAWRRLGEDFQPADGDDLLGAVLAAAPDFRLYHDSAGGAEWSLAIRGRRYFPDSALTAAIGASLSLAAEALGPVPVPLVSYTAELGHKGRMSGSLQGRASIGLVWEPSETLERARLHDVFHETLHLWFGGAMEAERWWTEGVTDYLAARLLARWRQQPQDLATLCYESLRRYQRIGHRLRMSMAEENRRHVPGDNTKLLVYRKGMLAGLLLDAGIRRASGGERSLDDVARALLALASTRRNRNVSEEEIGAAVAAAGGTAARRLWVRVALGTEPLTERDVADALAAVTGQAFRPPDVNARIRKELRR
jgi:predicted metalloprotease with PDZ domain